jgi:hypothetical protein
MTAETLSACIRQGLAMPPDEMTVSGLFAERTGVFSSLRYILTLSSPTADEQKREEERRLIYAVSLAPPPVGPPRRPWWREYPELVTALLVVAAGVVLHRRGDAVRTWAANAAVALLHATIELPLQELYGSGPWFLGWEGDPLPRICARITYHGDEAFWSRNGAECERIYAAKREAWMRLARPTMGLALLTVSVAVVRFTIWEWRRVRWERPPTDRDMVETYRAFQVLLRQVRRAMHPPVRHHDEERARR